MSLIREILLINQTCNGDCIIVGSACSYLNFKYDERNVNDIDIVISKSITIKKLSKLGEVIQLKPNPIYGLNIKRYYIKRKEYCIDIFEQKNKKGYEIIKIFDQKIKKLTIKNQISDLKYLVNRLKKLNKIKLMNDYKKKLIKLCA